MTFSTKTISTKDFLAGLPPGDPRRKLAECRAPQRTFAPPAAAKPRRAERGKGRLGRIKDRTPAVLALLGWFRLPAGVTVKDPASVSTPNGWERKFCERMRLFQTKGVIAAWDFQPIRVRLAAGAHYTPDFVIRYPSGRIEFVDVKGFHREAAMVRIKVCADRYPWATMVKARLEDGSWVFKTIDP